MKTRTKLLMLVGLVGLVGLSMGAFNYAARERVAEPKVAAFETATGTGTITDADGRSWTPTSAWRFAIVQLAPAATGNLYCRINETTANASSSEWDFCLQPGQSWSGFADVQLGIESIACFADADPGTEGATFIVKGCD